MKVHRKDLEEKILEDVKRVSKSPNMIDNFNQTWELVKICVDYLEENDSSWIKGKEKRIEERKRLKRLAEGKRKSIGNQEETYSAEDH